MKLSHVIVAIVFFLLGAACVFAYVAYGSFCLGDKPRVGIITEPRNVAEAPGAKAGTSGTSIGFAFGVGPNIVTGGVKLTPKKEKAPSSAAAPKISFRIEQAVNRHGSDYRDFEMAAGDQYGLCQKACADEAKCVAFTFVKAGVQGMNPHCWLKNTVPQAYPDTTCISGAKE